MGEKWPRILPKVATSTSLLGSFTCRNFTPWDRRLYFPSEGRRTEDFFARKIRRLRPGLNPRTWVPKASTLPPDHRSPYIFMTWTGITTYFNFHVFTAGVAEISIFCVSVPCCIICSFQRVRGTNPQYYFMISLHCLLRTENNAVSELSRYVPRELRVIRSRREVYGKHRGNKIQKTSRLQTYFVPLILPMRL